MAIEKRTAIGAVTIQPDGQMSVRVDTLIIEDGQVIARQDPHRFVLDPAVHDVSTLEHTSMVKTIAMAYWTPEIIEARKKALAEANREATVNDKPNPPTRRVAKTDRD